MTHEDSCELMRINQEWMQAWIDRDVATVDQLMSDEFLYVAPSGQMMDREALLSIVSSDSYKVESGSRAEVVVHAIGHEAAAVVSRWRGKGSFEGREFVDDHRVTSVFTRQAQCWQIALEHCCNINTPTQS